MGAIVVWVAVDSVFYLESPLQLVNGRVDREPVPCVGQPDCVPGRGDARSDKPVLDAGNVLLTWREEGVHLLSGPVSAVIGRAGHGTIICVSLVLCLLRNGP